MADNIRKDLRDFASKHGGTPDRNPDYPALSDHEIVSCLNDLGTFLQTKSGGRLIYLLRQDRVEVTNTLRIHVRQQEHSEALICEGALEHLDSLIDKPLLGFVDTLDEITSSMKSGSQ